jgi:hypothetical protein
MNKTLQFVAVDLSLETVADLAEGSPPEDDWFIAHGDLEEDVLLAPPYRCPNPTRWTQTTEAVRVPQGSGLSEDRRRNGNPPTGRSHIECNAEFRLNQTDRSLEVLRD